jgi:lysophospholipase L1-like esterase
MNTAQKIKAWLEGETDMFLGMLGTMTGSPRAWESSIRTFERRDRSNPPPSGAIVFTGSSSFTFWTSLQEDMAPLQVINRGFGGARMDDVVHYADRIVLPYHPRAVVLFAGTNDITWPRPATAQQVFAGYQAFVQRLQAELPDVPIYYVSITPTPARWRYWTIVQEANRLIQAHTRTDPRLHFIDLTPALLGPDGRPDRKLYRADRVHPNRKGYAVWKAAIKPVLLADFPTEE